MGKASNIVTMPDDSRPRLGRIIGKSLGGTEWQVVVCDDTHPLVVDGKLRKGSIIMVPMQIMDEVPAPGGWVGRDSDLPGNLGALTEPDVTAGDQQPSQHDHIVPGWCRSICPAYVRPAHMDHDVDAFVTV